MPRKILLQSVLLGVALSQSLHAAAPEKRPTLVVVVSVDQWRYEYLERFRDGLTDGIVQRCRQSGVFYSECLHQHAFTYTGPGHAVFTTGAYPNQTGIIANSWFDAKQQKFVYCVDDPTATLLGTSGDDSPVSPRMLLVETVGDQLKMATQRRSKVFGVAIKDRAAILMAGHLADAAFWMSNDGNWITADYYRAALPGYFRLLNQQRWNFRYAGQTWKPLRPIQRYLHGAVERSLYERPRYGMDLNFPHTLPTVQIQITYAISPALRLETIARSTRREKWSDENNSDPTTIRTFSPSTYLRRITSAIRSGRRAWRWKTQPIGQISSWDSSQSS